MNNFTLSANIVDITNTNIYAGTITVANGLIAAIHATHATPQPHLPYALPGFVDSHVHVESSLLVPSEFGRLAVVHGTVASISDPHEIANVCGIAGVHYMIENGKTIPFKFHFGAPSCVPATVFETAGATLDAQAVEELLQNPQIYYLSEMMNFPGVLHQDTEVMQKIAAAKKWGKPVDGHAPGLRGQAAAQYIAAGISTDHECFTAEEAQDKLALGMKILIREGSAAKNFDALAPLLHLHWQHMMFCSDDKHPDSLLQGHINSLCKRAVALGIDVFKVLQAACINPVQHYKMDVGLLQTGDAADFILINNLVDFNVQATYINGALVAANGKSLISSPKAGVLNQFNCQPVAAQTLLLPYQGQPHIAVIEALDGQLITNRLTMPPLIVNNCIVADTSRDVLKLVVINRYHPAPPAIAFVKNFGLQRGALASTVAHDSHNIIAVGTTDESLAAAINLVIAASGGISAVDGNGKHLTLGLPVAGLMTMEDGYEVAETYIQIDAMAKNDCGSTLASPFMTLSFMALLVIPHLKLSDKGLFNGDSFTFEP
jgi:adenine deaminase